MPEILKRHLHDDDDAATQPQPLGDLDPLMT
jgi:hypothetical protein